MMVRYIHVSDRGAKPVGVGHFASAFALCFGLVSGGYFVGSMVKGLETSVEKRTMVVQHSRTTRELHQAQAALMSAQLDVRAVCITAAKYMALASLPEVCHVDEL